MRLESALDKILKKLDALGSKPAAAEPPLLPLLRLRAEVPAPNARHPATDSKVQSIDEIFLTDASEDAVVQAKVGEVFTIELPD